MNRKHLFGGSSSTYESYASLWRQLLQLCILKIALVAAPPPMDPVSRCCDRSTYPNPNPNPNPDHCGGVEGARADATGLRLTLTRTLTRTLTLTLTLILPLTLALTLTQITAEQWKARKDNSSRTN